MWRVTKAMDGKDSREECFAGNRTTHDTMSQRFEEAGNLETSKHQLMPITWSASSFASVHLADKLIRTGLPESKVIRGLLPCAQ